MRPTALIIEDNLMNLELATDLLEAAGFSVVQAGTGEQGVQMATRLLPEIVLMDISLPGLDGLAATRALRGHPLTKRLIIVALTAHAMRGDEATALNAGCDGYISKPIDTRLFSVQVRSFLESHLAKPMTPRRDELAKEKVSKTRIPICQNKP